MVSTRIWSFLSKTTVALALIAVPKIFAAEKSVPVRFDLVGDGIELGSLKLNYEITGNDSLKLGNFEIGSKTFRMGMFKAAQLDSRLGKLLPTSEAVKDIWVVSWPEALFQEAVMEAISRSGDVVWSLDLDKDAQQKWAFTLDDWKKLFKDKGFKESQFANIPLFKTQFGMTNFSLNQVGIKEAVRFCVSSKTEVGKTRYCSTYMEPLKTKQGTKLFPVPQAAKPLRVFLMGDVAPLKQEVALNYGVEVPFFVEFPAGDTFEFLGMTVKPAIVDGYRNKDGLVQLAFEDMRPFQPAKLLNREIEGYLTKVFEWQRTIKDNRQYWSIELAKDQNQILIPGQGGGVFIQELKITKIPDYKSRVYLNAGAIHSTYSDSPTILGSKNANVKLSTQQISLKSTKTQFKWKFAAPNRGDYNTSYLTVNDGTNAFKAYYEAYKGYPRELSLRLTGTVGPDRGLIMLGEVAFNYWFENLFWWDHYYLSTQRWGASFKAFRSLTSFQLSSASSTLESMNFDLKYRFNPGLWGRDQTWGMVAGYVNTKYDVFNSTLLGGGIMWARSMPKLFDDVLNDVPFMNYPKWVDLEFIFYPVSTDKKVVTAGTYALNFHGKIMWTQTFFGEAGFGVKQYDFSQELSTREKKIFRLTSFYGTVGLGINF